MAKTSRQLWFTAKGSTGSGAIKHFSVYKEGRSTYIRNFDGQDHWCHSSVGSVESVKKEIMLVFAISVTEIQMQ